ncbi:platelet-derived growth factor receptor alpha-like [Sitodiplosis mosellana]|uniref:platelet-derived growth factor receptor alpha-like n=1 Tax=Sitodiplosis mosellana TaxID=263140 RepID=UPI002444544C|nr:platelet-derived growth factor receptor alpha-like [Sitodiplosis mosellana]
MTEFLIEHGAGVNAIEIDSWTPLHLAAENDHVKVAEILINHGAEVDAKNINKSVPLHVASKNGHVKVAEMLIKHDANVNVTDEFGFTPLHLAASNGDKNMVEFLIEKGGDVNAKDVNGFTPYDKAKTNGNDEVAKILMEHGGNPKETTKDNNSLIYIIVGVVALILVSAISITCLYVRMRRKNEVIRKLNAIELKCFELGNVDGISSNLTLDEQADLLPYDRKYEFPREKLKLGAQLGGGAFGVVYEGIADSILPNEKNTKVAVKMVKRMSNDEILRALIMELKIMVHLGQHLNLVNLLGAVTDNITRYDMMIIVEYCRYGCLQSILIKSRSSFIDQINRETDTVDSSINARKQRVENSAGVDNNDSYQTDYQSVDNSLYVRDPIDGDHQSIANSLYVQDPNDGNHQSIANSLYVRDPNDEHHQSVDNSHSGNCSADDVGTSSNLIDSDPMPQITTIDLLCWSFQITRGMHYLASRKMMHGDLAARNILLCNENVIKICDFGLARSLYKTEVYRKNKEALLPFKWLALESIKDHLFSIQTDVWAFGIVLWELFSLGTSPYPGLSGQDFYEKLLDGYRLEKPDFATQDIHDIMLSCWRVNPELRPSFDGLGRSISMLLDTSVTERFVNLNEPYLKANVAKYESGKTDYIALMGTPNFQAPPIPSVPAALSDQSAPSTSTLEFNTMVECHQQPDKSSTTAKDTYV